MPVSMIVGSTPLTAFLANSMEDGIMESMVVCRKLELISNTYPVTACAAPPKGETVTLSDGDLAGSRGILSKENDKTYFYLQLDSNSYAKIVISD